MIFTNAPLYKQHVLKLVLLLAICTTPHTARAAGFFGLSIGYYNALGDHHKSAVFKAEYIEEKSLLLKNLKPWIGLEFTSNTSAWLGGGLLYEIALNDTWSLSPSFGAGFYKHGTSDIDLDYPIEFKSQIRVSYALENKDKIALSFAHTSNAGLGDHNRGEETIAISYLKKIE